MSNFYSIWGDNMLVGTILLIAWMFFIYREEKKTKEEKKEYYRQNLEAILRRDGLKNIKIK